MTRVQVALSYLVVHDGVTYYSGDTPDVPDDVAQKWIESGWATEVKPTKASSPKRRGVQNTSLVTRRVHTKGGIGSGYE
jgi:hypothetical protein